MATLRPTTNLVIPQHLMLPKRELKAKFLYLYAKGYPGSEAAFMTKLWASVFFPAVTNDPKFGKERTKAAADALMKEVPAGYLTIKKHMGADPFFTVSVPVFRFSAHNAGSVLVFLKKWFLGEVRLKAPIDPTAEMLDNLRGFQTSFGDHIGKEIPTDTVISKDKILTSAKLDPVARDQLTQCLLGGRIVTKGNFCMVYLDFKITKEEAQQLTTTEWPQLRDIDLYPILLHWATIGWGERGITPMASFPVSKIAFSLPPSHVESARVNEYGISIGADGKPFYLPKVVDKQNTIAYEDRYAAAGTRADGNFTLIDMYEGAKAQETGTDVRTKLPVNTVVSIDWLNNKFAYTTTSGSLRVQDLTRFHKADASHIRLLMDERKVTDEVFASWANIGEAAGVPKSVRVTEEDLDPIDAEGAPLTEVQKESFLRTNDPITLFKVLNVLFKNANEEHIVVSDFSLNSPGLFKVLTKYLRTIAIAIGTNIDAVYNKYSVSGVSQTYSWLLIIQHYTDDRETLVSVDNTIRKAALDQKVDPNWKLPSVPFLSDEVGLLPHQMKVRNLLKDSPDFAILPVQAGGGKSPLLLIDVMLEIKANRNDPYLVLCPGHLVANYVSEASFFTKGKINVIAITNRTVHQNGFKRLQKMLEGAPRNTVVVADYDCLRFRPRAVSYGTTPVTVFPVIDFLRQFKFGYVALDESHKTKNDTSRTRAVMGLIADIPKKRLASGTMVHDSASDLANQISMMDPTLFGTRAEFNDRYGEVVNGDRVIKWRPGAEKAIMDKIKTRVVVAGAMRKEWAALLPTKREWIGVVTLTDSQYNVYNDILDETLARIEEDAKNNKELQKLFKKGVSSKDAVNDPSAKGEEEEENEVDEDEGEDLASLLKPYLSRLEQFLIAPGRDVLGSKVLQGEDLISPKALEILSRIEAHIKGKDGYGPFPGKVLIFSNQIASAEEVFNLASPELKKCGILYKAENKQEDGAKFEKDPHIKWMIGVGKSMEEGLNFQFASRIIRTETVWNPGSLEQSNSRINRPELKKEETRKEIFYDTIVVDRSIDITKTARLISKVIAAAKFENAEVPEYQSIPEVPIIKMSLDSIRELNHWDTGDESGIDPFSENPEEGLSLKKCALALRVYEKVRNDDYENYKKAYIEKHGTGPIKSFPELAPTPPDAKLMKRVPYVPGMSVYSEKDLGLLRIDEYLNISFDDDDAEEEEAPDEAEETGEDEASVKARALKGQLVHTEFGEGYIRSCTAKSKFVIVDLIEGYSVRQRKSQVFLVTRAETSTKDVRDGILKSIGDLPITAPIDVPAHIYKLSRFAEKVKKEAEEKQKVKQEKKRVQQKQKDLSIELHFAIVNGFLGVNYLIDESNQTAMQTLQASGFRMVPQFYYAKIINAGALNNQMTLWKNSGMMADPAVVKQGVFQAFQEMYALLKNGRIKNHQDTFKMTQAQKVVNFYRLEHKASNDKKLFKPYPLIEDGVAYIALPAGGQAGTKEAMRLKRPSFKWRISEPTLSFFGSTQQVLAMMKHLAASGVSVSNVEDLREQFKKLKTMKIRSETPDIPLA